MASHPPPPPEHPRPPALTTISALGDDQLREIFLRLPDLPSLASAAFTCRAFLGAVRSSRAFRRRFRELHAPPLLALFLTPYMHTVPTFPASRRPSADFAPLQDHAAATDSEWQFDLSDSAINYDGGFICTENRTTKLQVYYNPQTKALILYPKEHHATCLEFHILSPEEEQRPFRVVCVRRDYSWARVRVAVFSSDTTEWQIFPETVTPLHEEGLRHVASRYLCCWQFESMSAVSQSGYILVLNTDTFQFSRIDLPPPLTGLYPNIKIGQTKDRGLCIVSEKDCTLSLWLCTACDDGVQRFVLRNMFPLHASFMEVTNCPVEDTISVQLMTLFNGFVYLSICPWKKLMDEFDFKSPQWFLSFSLETGELNQHFKNTQQLHCPVHPYFAWPPSLICSGTVDSESEVTGNSVGDVGPESTEKAPSALITALQSLKEALSKDEEANVADIKTFLLDDEKNSLVRKITAFDELLTNVRDRVLMVGADSEFCGQKTETETESWWQMCKGKLWGAFFAS